MKMTRLPHLVFFSVIFGLACAATPLLARAATFNDPLTSTNTDDLDASVREQLQQMENGAKAGSASKALAADPLAAEGMPAAKTDTVETVPTTKSTKSAAAALAESEIPAFTSKKKMDVKESTLSQKLALSFLVIFGLLGGGVLFLKRYRQNNREKSKHTQIKILTQHFLGPKKSLAIVRVAGESVLIGITDHSISMIKQLHMLDEDLAEEEAPAAFDSTFGRRLTGRAEPEENDDDTEAFAMHSIQDRITRQGTEKTRKKRFFA